MLSQDRLHLLKEGTLFLFLDVERLGKRRENRIRAAYLIQGDKALATAEERAELSYDLQSQARFSDPGGADQC